MKSIIALTDKGWSHVQLDNVMKLQKSWNFDDKEYRADVFFGTMRDGRWTPTVIMNVYEQGASVNHIIDDNCDIWNNVFTSTTKESGNEYFKYLLKHGFKKVALS